MTSLAWTEALGAPRSLATRDTHAVTIIEDPGVLHLARIDASQEPPASIRDLLGVSLPERPWQSVASSSRRVVWTGPGRWTVLGPRLDMASLAVALRAGRPWIDVSNMTGAFSLFRIVGRSAFDCLLRVCPLDLTGVEKDEARATQIAGIRCLVIRETGPVDSWMVLAPRSYAGHVGAALVEAARLPGLGLFEAAAPPPV